MSNLKNQVRPRALTTEVNLNLYKKNFFVASYGGNESYISSTDKFIFFKTPVSNDKFELKNIYDITENIQVASKKMKALLFHVSDSTSDSRIDETSKFFLEGKCYLETILNPKTCKTANFNTTDTDWIIVFVINTISNICEINLTEGFLPDEGGGGVIIKHP